MILAALAALAFLRRKVEWGTGWVWPVPNLRTSDGKLYEAVISDGVGSPRGQDLHRGVDIFYRRTSKDDRPEYKSGTSDGTPLFFNPRGVPILAARDGFIWSSGKTARGYSVVIDHGRPFATYYTHMEKPAFPDISHGVISSSVLNPGRVLSSLRVPVKAGDIIGWMGWDPLDARKLRHLHFSVAHNGIPERDAVDPAPAMKTWPRVDWEHHT